MNSSSNAAAKDSLSMADILQAQRSYFRSGATKSIEFRIQHLRALKNAISKHESEILEALHRDLHKPLLEAFTGEVGFIYDEIEYALRNLRQWARPQKVRTPLLQFRSSSEIYFEPLGVNLIIGPWNYPFHLMIAPLVGSIAAGNCAILKPSEISPATSRIIHRLISNTFDAQYLSVVEGGVAITQELLAEKFDHIFFTGGTEVGRKIMEAASKHLTPVTLELGGKSPCLVDVEVPIEKAAQRIVWGKFFNAGQTCVAPDYLLLPQSIEKAFLLEMQNAVMRFYTTDPFATSDYARVINSRHFQRLTHLLKQTRGQILMGGTQEETSRYLAPTLVTQVSWDDPLMAEEIFGPILPILTYSSLESAIAQISERPKPLAFYFFSENKSNQAKVLNEIPFGGGCINDTLVHLSNPQLPFGGVGDSGIGAYHGKFSFETFSHRKGVLKKSFFFDPDLRYPPYGKKKLNILKRLMEFFR